MPRSATFIVALSAFLGGLFAGCYDGSATCRYELACANQEGLIATCCSDSRPTAAHCSNSPFPHEDTCVGAGHQWTEATAHCSNDNFLNQGSCEEAGHEWTETTSHCSTSDLLTQGSCEAAGHRWIEEVQSGTTTCWYETPDGALFTCDPIEDEARAGTYCVQAAEALTTHCSD